MWGELISSILHLCSVPTYTAISYTVRLANTLRNGDSTLESIPSYYHGNHHISFYIYYSSPSLSLCKYFIHVEPVNMEKEAKRRILLKVHCENRGKPLSTCFCILCPKLSSLFPCYFDLMLFSALPWITTVNGSPVL